jgi:hypothetical protein
MSCLSLSTHKSNLRTTCKQEESAAQQQQQQQQPQDDKRSVTFCEMVERFDILSLDDYTPQEKRVCWFQYEEYDTITKNCRKLIRKMERGFQVQITSKYCTRGLDHMTKAGLVILDRKRSQVYDAVFEVQEELLDMGFMDDDEDESISQIYQALSFGCKQSARELAVQDELAVKAYSVSLSSLLFTTPMPMPMPVPMPPLAPFLSPVGKSRPIVALRTLEEFLQLSKSSGGKPCHASKDDINSKTASDSMVPHLLSPSPRHQLLSPRRSSQ